PESTGFWHFCGRVFFLNHTVHQSARPITDLHPLTEIVVVPYLSSTLIFYFICSITMSFGAKIALATFFTRLNWLFKQHIDRQMPDPCSICHSRIARQPLRFLHSQTIIEISCPNLPFSMIC